ncbi:MAG: hypothetical protein Q9201_005374 [Fulgogasparrea decipioides]
MFTNSYRSPSQISRLCLPRLGLLQRRWAQVHDVRFLVTHHQTDKFTEKYRERLHQKAKQEGLQSVDELKALYKARDHGQKKPATTDAANIQQWTAPFSIPPPPCSPELRRKLQSPARTQPSTPPGLKTLSSYLDLSKTLALPPKEIENIWRLRHASSATSLCATIPSSTYTQIQQTARKYPQFILPLPREGSSGAEIHFLQWSFPAPDTVTVVFTYLAEYKLRGEFSQPHTTVTMHLELMQEKGLVLMQGQVAEGRGVTVCEAQRLVLCLQKFYSGEEAATSKRRLLEKFNQGDRGFTVEELWEEAEKIMV